MRAFRLALASLLVVIGATVAAAPSAYADTEASLGVSPNHGSPDAAFTAIVRWQPSRHGKNRQCAPDQVTFTWDGAALGDATAALTGGACVAVLRATPPPGEYNGTSNHVIGVSGVRAARTRYIVVASAAAATPTATDATPDATAPTDLPSADGQTTGPAAGSAPIGGATAATATGTGLTGASRLVMVFGLLLFLAGCAALGALVWRARRTRTGDGAEALPDDLTRPIPFGATQQPLPADATQPIPFHATQQPLPADATQPLPADAAQPLADPTRPMPLPRQPGDEQIPQTFHLWPPRPGGQRGE